MFRKILVALVIGLLLTGCIGSDKNRAPTVAQVNCPETAKVGAEISVFIVATDRDQDRISYKLAFGDGTQSEWSEFLESGVTKTFSYIYNEPGIYGICGIASDEHHKNSGWSEKTCIKVKEPQIGPERIMFCVPPNADFQRIKDLGITVIQHYSIYWEHYSIHRELKYGKQYLDKADSYGLKVLYYMGAMIQDLIRQGKPWSKEDCKRLIENFDKHPALWGWQAYDEPDGGSDNPSFIIPMEIQKEVHDSLKAYGMKKLFANTLRGGTRGWYLVDLSLWDVIMPDCYVYDGTGQMWGMEPLEALEVSAKQCSEYLENYPEKQVIYMFQACDQPAEDSGHHNTQVPSGHIEQQFRVLERYNLFTGGLSLWAWNGGYFSPCMSSKLYIEIKNLFDKINNESIVNGG